MNSKSNTPIPPVNPEVKNILNSYPPVIKERLLFLRKLIYETAAAFEEVGPLEETLKWGEPGYVTAKSKIGSTVRIDWKAKTPEQYSIFFKCTANLVPAFKERYPNLFRYGGDRSIDFHPDEKAPVRELKQCIAMALTYHINKKLEHGQRWNMVERIDK